MKRAWLFWWVVTIGLAAYVMAGLVASHTNQIEIKLEPGTRVEVTPLRLTEDRLRMSLVFRGDHRQRPELGDYVHGEWYRTRLVQFLQPGSAVRIAASAPENGPVVYEAMPKAGWGANDVVRNLTSNLSVRPGVWRWPDPPDTPQFVLRPGFTTVTIEVVSVEPPLVGESVQLHIHPPLGFKACMPGVCWLWWSFFWLVGALVQVLWATGILAITWNKARREKLGSHRRRPGSVS